MTARLTPTEAVLACAAAETAVEILAARMALIEHGTGVLTQLDHTLLQGADHTDPEAGGLAGQYLLGGVGFGPADTCGRRSRRIQHRLMAELARPADERGADL